MFRKQFRIKSKVQLKSSEHKKLLSELKVLFPLLTDTDITNLSKESISRARIITFNEEPIDVFFTDKTPIVIDITDLKIRLPTIHLLWMYPDLILSLTTNQFVLEKLKGGAHLFLPGVHNGSINQEGFSFTVNQLAAVNTETNSASVAVGTFSMNTLDMVEQHSGKIVHIYHTVGDLLFKLHSMSIPTLGPPKWLKNENLEDLKVESIKIDEVIEDETEKVEKTEKEKMDELLEYCFFKSIKTASKTIYPILPANLFANYILPAVPDGLELNIKKTSWKKFSSYLQEQVKQGVIAVETLQKNELKIISVDHSHYKIRKFIDPYQQIIVEPKTTVQGQPSVQQVFSVTSATLQFFTTQGYKKSDQLTRQDVRNLINDYIKKEQLQDPIEPEKVRLNPVLYDIVRNEVVSRADLLTSILNKMSVEHKVSNVADGEVHVHKGKMPLIEFNVCNRAGNKKVTLISNLDCYGVDMTNFTKDLQQKAAASAILQPGAPGTKGPQVLVQGNQVRQAAQLLTEKYNLAEKFMRGLEKAPKSKK